MATNDESIRNPQVDYERADLSPRGILLFLIGLFIVGFFIELVIWGMFRFMAKSEIMFAKSQVTSKLAPKRSEEGKPGDMFQNTPGVDLSLFPVPRLQTNDAGEMQDYLQSERKLLNPDQPFQDASGAIHIPVSLAMKLVVERGLPVRPNPPQHLMSSQTGAGNPELLHEVPGNLPAKGPGAPAAQTDQDNKPPRAP